MSAPTPSLKTLITARITGIKLEPRCSNCRAAADRTGRRAVAVGQTSRISEYAVQNRTTVTP